MGTTRAVEKRSLGRMEGKTLCTVQELLGPKDVKTTIGSILMSSIGVLPVYAAAWTGLEKEVLTPIRITRQARWPKRRQPIDMHGHVTSGDWFSNAFYMGRNRWTRVLCGSI